MEPDEVHHRVEAPQGIALHRKAQHRDPQVTATQGKDGTVTVNVQENMRNPYQPVGQGIASNVNINVNESATNASVTGTVSGAPSFETNFTTQGGTTMNLPLQSAPQSTAGFIIGLQQTNQVNKKIEVKKDDPQ